MNKDFLSYFFTSLKYWTKSLISSFVFCLFKAKEDICPNLFISSLGKLSRGSSDLNLARLI